MNSFNGWPRVKAFDCVNRSALLYKMHGRGFRGKFFKFISSRLKIAKSRVQWDSTLDELFQNLYGVLQGGVISSSLFNLFMEDLVDYFDSSKGVNMGSLLIF